MGTPFGTVPLLGDIVMVKALPQFPGERQRRFTSRPCCGYRLENLFMRISGRGVGVSSRDFYFHTNAK
ncbi:hypothetical protein [Oryza sativa Japonica Group]|uniref:Uncharacterized protein n=1 Tax=Oryza sativa subsp. japonica TaxID=39947 RepID=Q656S7_ORYSJ|nr:hypothetical protein [Oryza sativa Japonica Group]BAD45183.1 hypothetical protein [Oryza sativa Japonica Group]